MLIDTHCHLNFKAFEGRVKQIIQRAKKAGVEKIIIPGTNLETSRKTVELAQKYDQVYAAIGIHPHHAKEITNYKLQITNELKKLAKSKKVVAIGECGLDYHQYQKTKYDDYKIDEDFKNQQKEVFEMQIDLAKKANLPLIIHNREASKDILSLLTDHHSLLTNSCVLHCFQGEDNLLDWILENNFYIGITGIVTYNKKMQAVVRKTPLKNILIETDSPYLMPEPIKKTKKWPNEPKNVKIVAKRIAKIKGDSFLEITNQTTNNAVKLFKLS